MSSFLAFDFGASSGRAVLANLNDGKITMEEVYRFSNDPVFLGDKYIWDFPRLLNELKTSLKKVARLGVELKGIGIDTWGVDYGLLDKSGNLIGIPIHYRDKKNYLGVEKAEEILSLKDLYLRSGIALNTFNTSFQLLSDKEVRSDILEKSESLLFMPDLFAYYLTGEIKNEFTIASTSGLLDMDKKNWDMYLIKKLGLPERIFKSIINPGEIYGYLTDEIMEETGICKIPVIAIGGHDTASAVLGTPLKGANYAYLSSGTWSLLGVEVDNAIKNDKSYNYLFTNEGGAGEKIRLLKNINGLWLLQQLKKSWSESEKEIEFEDIIREGRKFKDSNFIVTTNDSSLMNTKNMIKSIKTYCVNHGQGEPRELGEFAMAVYNGLTKEYKETIENIEELIGNKIDGINIVGGGIKDRYLSELTAERTGKKIIAGPIEAAVLGNILMQCISCGEINSIEEGRRVIENSFIKEMYVI